MKLLNSAMMPQKGSYKIFRLQKEAFVDILKAAYAQNAVQSYISYPQNIDILEELTGIRFPLSREETVLEDTDIMLVMKLKYRVAMGTKGQKVDPNDFEYFQCLYSKSIN